jgi:hypothetical protein
MSSAPNYEPPSAPVAMSELDGPVLFLPSDGRDTRVQFWTIDGFVDMANGSAAFTPDELTGIREMSKSFPGDESLAALRGAGIETVVVVQDWLPGSEWAGLDTEAEPSGVDVERTDTVVVYDLNP